MIPSTKLAPRVEPSKNYSATMYEQIVETTKSLVGTEFLYFSMPFIVNQAWQEMNFWGICVSPSNQVYLMDGFQDWHEVREGDSFLSDLLDKMHLISKQYKAA